MVEFGFVDGSYNYEISFTIWTVQAVLYLVLHKEQVLTMSYGKALHSLMAMYSYSIADVTCC